MAFPASKKLTALVVDDDSTCRMIHTAILRSVGFEACAVDDGNQAIELLRSGAKFDFILMDIFMPGMNGNEVTKELRAMGVDSMIIGTEVIPDMYTVQELNHAGFDGFYEKPLFSKSAALLHQELMKMK